MERRAVVSAEMSVSAEVWGSNRGTWLVSTGSHISNKRKRDHSTAEILCFWSAFLAEKVCTVMLGQSDFRSRSRRRRFVTKSLTCEGGSGLFTAGLFVLTDVLRARPFADGNICEVGRDMLVECSRLRALFGESTQRRGAMARVYSDAPPPACGEAERFRQNNAKPSSLLWTSAPVIDCGRLGCRQSLGIRWPRRVRTQHNRPQPLPAFTPTIHHSSPIASTLGFTRRYHDSPRRISSHRR